MTAKKTKKLDQRKRKILSSVVNDYVHTAEPVSSDKLAKKYFTDISPATIRHELAALEDEGLLMHPHTSSGRIPADAGYRYFVDQLMKIKDLTNKEIEFIETEFKKSANNLEDLLHTSLRVVSTLSHLLAVITAPKMPFKAFSSGFSNILEQPEFNDPEQIKNILNVVEHEDVISGILDGTVKDENISIKIGSEIKHKKIKDCSIVVSRYDMLGQSVGTVSVIGPTRMSYDKVSSIVNAVSKTLKEILREKS